jgi:hypothetical protein
VSLAPEPPAPPGVQSEIESLLTNASASAAAELFSEYNVSLEDGDVTVYRSAGDLAFLGVVSYMAPGLSGTLVLGLTPKVLRRSNPCQTSDRDWAGELANQLFGRVKLKLLRRGLELWSVAPAVVDGTHLIPAVTHPGFDPHFFKADTTECVALWIEVEIGRDVRLDTAAPDQDIPTEGDVILF